jgi:uncharacterized protein YndB with AHSA1/START domain
MTLEAEFEASPERVWQLWADPRQLERWWGPPTYPATVDAHDLRPGGQVEYYVTGPEGDQPRGFWHVDEVEPPHRLVLRDGLANEDGTLDTELLMTTARVTIKEIGGGKTRMSIESEFPTVEAMESPSWAWRRASRRLSARSTRSWPTIRSRLVEACDDLRELRQQLPGKPPVVDLATWQAVREELQVREKAHTREGDAIAAARRRLPMVELDGAVEVTGVDGPVPFVDLFQGRDELVVYKHMWYDGAPYQGQCEGCTTTAGHGSAPRTSARRSPAGRTPGRARATRSRRRWPRSSGRRGAPATPCFPAAKEASPRRRPHARGGLSRRDSGTPARGGRASRALPKAVPLGAPRVPRPRP